MSDAIAWALESARQQTLALVADLDDGQICLQTMPEEHHPGWILGHLLLGHVYLLALLEVEALAEDFSTLLRSYGPGSTPTTAADSYPSKRILTEQLATTGARPGG